MADESVTLEINLKDADGNVIDSDTIPLSVTTNTSVEISLGN